MCKRNVFDFFNSHNRKKSFIRFIAPDQSGMKIDAKSTVPPLQIPMEGVVHDSHSWHQLKPYSGTRPRWIEGVTSNPRFLSSFRGLLRPSLVAVFLKTKVAYRKPAQATSARFAHRIKSGKYRPGIWGLAVTTAHPRRQILSINDLALAKGGSTVANQNFSRTTIPTGRR